MALNEVHIEGVVVTRSEFKGTQFLRIACEHDPGRSGPDGGVAYITLRVEPPLAAVAAALRPGARVRASGYLISRDYGISLSRFAKVAQASEGAEEALQRLRALAEQAGGEIFKPHTTTEVMVERLLVE